MTSVEDMLRRDPDSPITINDVLRTMPERGVKEGFIQGIWYDPLDEVEAWAKDELRRSRSREEGERRRQRWLMDVLVAVGAARQSGVATLAEYPPAEALRTALADPVGTDG